PPSLLFLVFSFYPRDLHTFPTRRSSDLKIIDTVLESGRALVLAFNKWDLIDADRRHALEREIQRDLSHVAWAPRVNLSALTGRQDRKSTRLNSSHVSISYAVFFLKKKNM